MRNYSTKLASLKYIPDQFNVGVVGISLNHTPKQFGSEMVSRHAAAQKPIERVVAIELGNFVNKYRS